MLEQLLDLVIQCKTLKELSVLNANALCDLNEIECDQYFSIANLQEVAIRSGLMA